VHANHRIITEDELDVNLDGAAPASTDCLLAYVLHNLYQLTSIVQVLLQER